jgi:hypothetical protein
MQSIYAYSNLGNNSQLIIDSNASSHDFRDSDQCRRYFIQDHECSNRADLCIVGDPTHGLDYLNNQFTKQEKSNILKSIQISFPTEFEQKFQRWPDVTVTAEDATMRLNQSNWMARQVYHNSQSRCNKWVQDVVEDIETVSPCQTILDEAYVQYCLREQGYEIHCDGLDIFPTNSRDLRELIYENRNTDN